MCRFVLVSGLCSPSVGETIPPSQEEVNTKREFFGILFRSLLRPSAGRNSPAISTERGKIPLRSWVRVCPQTITPKKCRCLLGFLDFRVIVGRQFTPFFFFFRKEKKERSYKTLSTLTLEAVKGLKKTDEYWIFRWVIVCGQLSPYPLSCPLPSCGTCHWVVVPNYKVLTSGDLMNCTHTRTRGCMRAKERRINPLPLDFEP